MKEITRQWFQLTRDPRIEHTERTLASYIFQEKEAISRNAKIALCTQKGHQVHNLQHDGIIVNNCEPTPLLHKVAQLRSGAQIRP